MPQEIFHPTTSAQQADSLIAALKKEALAIDALGRAAGGVITQALGAGVDLYGTNSVQSLHLEAVRQLFPAPPTSVDDAGMLGAHAKAVADLSSQVLILANTATSASQQAAANAALAKTTGGAGGSVGGSAPPASGGMSGTTLAVAGASILGVLGLAWYLHGRR